MADARIRLALDGVQSVIGGLNRVGERIGAVAGSISTLTALGGTLSAAAFAGWVKGAIDAADAAGKLSAKTGVAVEDVAGLELAYQLAGLGGDALAGSMSKLSKGMVDGSGTLDALGIKTKNLDGTFRSTKDVLYTVADSFKGMDDGAQKTALAVDLFGRSGADMIPLLNGGSEALREMDDMARQLGLTITEETQKDAEAFNDTLDLVGKGAQGVARGIAAELLPTLSSVAGSFLQAMTSGDMLKNTAQFLATGLKILYTVGVGIVEVFSTVGKTIAAAGAQVVAILSGDFKLARDIGMQWSSDIGAGWAATAKSISAAWDTSGNAVVDTMTKASQKSGAIVEAGGKAAKKDAAERLSDYQKLSQSIAGKIAADEAQLAVGRTLSESEKILAKLLADRASGAIKITDTEQVALELAIKKLGVGEQQIEEEKFYAEAAKKREEISAALIQSTTGEADKNEELARTFGMTKSAIEAEELARLELRLAQIDNTKGYTAEIYQLEELIDAKRRSVAASGRLEGMEAEKKFNDERIAEQKKTVEQYDGIFRKGFAGMVNGGKGAWKSFTTSLVTTFKTSVADQIYKMFAQPFVVKMVASMLGVAGSGAAGMAQAADGGGSLFGSAMNLYSAGKAMYAGFTSGIAGTLGGGIASIGSMIGSSAVSAFGAGMSGVVGFGPTVAGAATGIGSIGAGASIASGAAASTGAAGAGAAGVGAAGAIPIVGWVIAAMATANALYKKGWDSTNGTLSTTGKILGSASLLADKFHRALGMSNTAANIFSGQAIVSRLFGRKNPEVENFGIEGTVNSAGVSADSYQNILEKGGYFRSNKRYKTTQELDAGRKEMISGTFDVLMSSVKAVGASLGLEASRVENYSKKFTLALTTDDAKNQEALAGMFTGMGEDMAKSILTGVTHSTEAVDMTVGGAWKKLVSDGAGYALDVQGGVLKMLRDISSVAGPDYSYVLRDNETYSAALQRLSGSLVAVNSMLDTLNLSLLDASVASGVAASSLVDLFGGLESMKTVSAGYFNAYYSEQEKVDIATRQLAKTFADLGYVMPAATEAGKAQLRAQINAALAGGEAEQKKAVQLMGMSAAFAALTGSAEQLAASAQTAAQATQQAAQEAQQAAERDATQARQAATSAALDSVKRAIDAEKSRIAVIRDVAAESVNSIKGVFGLLKDQVSQLYGTVGSTSAMQAAQGNAFIDKALKASKSGGYLPDQQAFADAIAAARGGLDASLYATQFEADKAALVMAGKLSQLQVASGTQLTTAEHALKTANDQLHALDDQLEFAQKQFDALNSIDAGIAAGSLSVVNALSGLSSAILAQKAGSGIFATNTGSVGAGSSGIPSVSSVKSVDSLGLTSAQRMYYDSIINAPGQGSADEILKYVSGLQDAQALASVPGFAFGGDFGGGLRIVGENGPEIEATGASRIWNANQTRAILSGGGNTERLERLVEGLTDQVILLKAELVEIKGSSSRTAEATNGRPDRPMMVTVEPA